MAGETISRGPAAAGETSSRGSVAADETSSRGFTQHESDSACKAPMVIVTDGKFTIGPALR